MVGTGIAVAFARSPMTVAQTAWQLAGAAGGRFVLGLGSQVQAHIERRYSMPWHHPVEQMRDYVEALPSIWH
jgi:alkanesulfonate monooxygenase SsuD/methylene tetrahydromethanopterin reductase-like flavin-dependent oxidoreductase (luciferase family)